ncbi:MAG: hypothetical protein AAGM36_02555 [Cyanobacteria bacterium J06597_1]
MKNVSKELLGDRLSFLGCLLERQAKPKRSRHFGRLPHLDTVRAAVKDNLRG